MLLGEKNEVDYRLFNILHQLIEKEGVSGSGGHPTPPFEWSDHRIRGLVDTAAKLTRQAFTERDKIIEERDSNKKDNPPC